MTLPVYVINLDRRSDRLQAISDNLQRIGVAWQRVSAVDAISCPPPKHQKKLYHQMTLGHFACTQSHLKALKAFLDTSHPAAVILEDDAEIASDFPALLESTEWLPQGCGLIKLDTLEKRNYTGVLCGSTPTGSHLRTIEGFGTSSMAYLITRDVAQFVLDSADNKIMAIDRVLFDLIISGTARKLRPLWVIPSVVRERGSSDIKAYDIGSNLSRNEKWKANLRKFPWKIRLNILRMSGKVQKNHIPYSEKFRNSE